MKKNDEKNKGFTLLEILIALTIFVLLSLISSIALNHFLNTKKRLSFQIDRLHELELAFLFIQRDSQQLVNKSLRDKNLSLLPAFSGNKDAVVFSRAGVINPEGQQKMSTLQRVKLYCQKNKLIRRVWSHLDPLIESNFKDKILISNLKHCYFSYFNQNLDELNEWRANAVQANQIRESLPKAIQLNITLNDWGAFSYLFPIALPTYIIRSETIKKADEPDQLSTGPRKV